MPLIQKTFKRLHYPIDVIAQCVRWYLTYALSLRNLEEMMAERGVIVDHSTLPRWVIRLVPLLDKAFRWHKRRTGRRWRWSMDETDIKIKGQWKYLYRTVDSNGQTIDFLLTAKRDATAALQFSVRPSGIMMNPRSPPSRKVVPTRQRWPRSMPIKQKVKVSPSGRASI